MKTEEQLKVKLKELNKRMTELMPTKKSNQELESKVRELIEGKGDHLLFLLHQTGDMTNVISTDAQRYLLEWILDED